MIEFTTKETKGKMVLLATILASGMSILATTTVGIAIPSIQEAFKLTISDIQWILNSYALSLAVLVLISGSLSDHFGRKKIFLYGIVGFTFGSLLSAYAVNAQYLIFFQVIQGIGAAMMIPGSLAIINVSFAKEEHGKVIGLWAGFSGAMAASGSLVGGWLVGVFGWTSVFWLNVPLGILVFFIAKRYIFESYNLKARSIDWLGAFLLAISLSATAYGLIQGVVYGWSDSRIILSFIAGFVALLFFIIVEKIISEPLVPLNIFKAPLVLSANLATFMLYFAFNGAIVFLILNIQHIQGFSPFKVGLALLPPVLIIALFSGWAGSLADRIGPRMQTIVGPFIVSVGMIYLAFSGADANYFTNFFPGLILLGIGMAFNIAPLTKSALRVKNSFSGLASGINNAAARIAALMAVAILGSVMAAFFASNITERVQRLPISSAEKEIILNQQERLGGIEIPESFNSRAKKHTQIAINESFIAGFKWVMIINAIFAFAAAVIAFFGIHNSAEIKYHKKREEIVGFSD